MRPHEIDYGEFDDLDDFGFPDVRAIRRMTHERQKDELRLHRRKRSRPSGKNRWQHDEWSDYEDYGDIDFDDYNAEEFDTFSGLSVDHH